MRTELIPDQILRSSRKTLSVCIDGRGRLIVRAPKRYPQERIFAFLQEKEGWIRKKLAEKEKNLLPLPPQDLEGYAFPLLGKTTRISLYEGKKVLLEGDTLYVPKERGREKLVAWLKAQAKELLGQETEKQAKRMGVEYPSVRISGAKTRWGSCSGKNALRYTFRLCYCPVEIIEYVVVHELAHIRHKNHSPAFWREVEKYLPDWRVRRKWLKAQGILMEIF